MACRTGCPTKDHHSWGACARAARLSTRHVINDHANLTNAELSAYRKARRDGLDPAGTTMEAIEDARKAAS